MMTSVGFNALLGNKLSCDEAGYAFIYKMCIAICAQASASASAL